MTTLSLFAFAAVERGKPELLLQRGVDAAAARALLSAEYPHAIIDDLALELTRVDGYAIHCRHTVKS